MSNNGHLSPEEAGEITFAVKALIRVATVCDPDRELYASTALLDLGEAEYLPVLFQALEKELGIHWSDADRKNLRNPEFLKQVTVGHVINWVIHKKEKAKSQHV